MLTMHPSHRQALTGALLRILKAGRELEEITVLANPTADSWMQRMVESRLGVQRTWTSQQLHVSARTTLHLSFLAALEHGKALFELCRSKRQLAMPLATVTRATLESYGRVFWLLTADSADEMYSRCISLEYTELYHPARLGAFLRRLPDEKEARHPVDQYRKTIRDWAETRGVPIASRGPASLATTLLASLFGEDEAGRVYSELSATAHGQPWAAANYYDFEDNRLFQSDGMLMEYCMLTIDSTRVICDLLAHRFLPNQLRLEKWVQQRDGAYEMIRSFISRQDPASLLNRAR